ncbi:MAG: methionine biosynthesis protein MetW [Candidatus Omnitrophota bacterium]
MIRNLQTKVRYYIKGLKSPFLRSALMYFFRHVNLIRVIVEDAFVMLKDVKLYRKESLVDYEQQWSARLGKSKSSIGYNYFGQYRDPEGLDENNMRGDDIFISSILPSKCSVLELGCGNGRLGYILKHKKDISYCGFDISEVAIEEAKKKGLEAYVCNLDNFNDHTFKILSKRHFDYIISLWTLQLLNRQEELITKLFDYGDTQLHGVWNAGHWTSRLRMLFGRFPIYSYASDPNGKRIYPYPYGAYNRHWTFNDFKAYVKELGFFAIPVGMGPKFCIRTARLHKHLFWPSLRAGRLLWKIIKRM